MFIDETARTDFSSRVQKMLARGNVSAIEAVIGLAEDMGIEPSAAAGLLDAPLRSRLEDEFRARNMLRDGNSRNRTPIF